MYELKPEYRHYKAPEGDNDSKKKKEESDSDSD